MGKINSKYLIIEILGYSNDYLTLICKLFHSCSRQMRELLIKNYTAIKNILYETHCSLDEMVLLTHNFKTSKAVHQRLEGIMKRECEKALKIDYGLQMLPDTVLQIANHKQFEWLLQSELKAIKDGLTYVQVKNEDYGYIYRGYVNAKGQK